MAGIPQFNSLEEAAEFWDTHDFEDYVDATEPVTIAVSVPQRRKSLTVPLPLDVYERIEALASRRGVPVEELVGSWLKERVK